MDEWRTKASRLSRSFQSILFVVANVVLRSQGSVYRGRDEIDASRASSGVPTVTFGINQLPSPRNRAMADGSDGQRAALVSRQFTPELISSLPGTTDCPPSISFFDKLP